MRNNELKLARFTYGSFINRYVLGVRRFLSLKLAHPWLSVVMQRRFELSYGQPLNVISLTRLQKYHWSQ